MTMDTLRGSAAVALDWLDGSSWYDPCDFTDISKPASEFLAQCDPNAILDLLAAHDADKARIAVLEGALRPFALAANNYDDRTGETPYQITIGQLRAAREALTTQASEVE